MGKIATDELVVLVSDGVLERAAPGTDAFGEDGLHSALQGLTAPSAAAAAAAVLDAVGRSTTAPCATTPACSVLAPC